MLSASLGPSAPADLFPTHTESAAPPLGAELSAMAEGPAGRSQKHPCPSVVQCTPCWGWEAGPSSSGGHPAGAGCRGAAGVRQWKTQLNSFHSDLQCTCCVQGLGHPSMGHPRASSTGDNPPGPEPLAASRRIVPWAARLQDRPSESCGVGSILDSAQAARLFASLGPL